MGSVSDFQPKTITDFLRQISMLTNAADRTSKLDDLVKNLQDEMKKIDAFKRELPFCMLLLNDGQFLGFSNCNLSLGDRFLDFI